MADLNAKYATKFLHYHGFITRTDVTSRFIGHDKADDIGRADIFAGKGGRALNLEIKQAESSFNLDNLRQNQHDYAVWSMGFPFEIPYWLYFTMGKHPAHYNPAKYSPKMSWVLPYHIWKQADDAVRPHQKSLVFKAKKGMNKAIQALKLDAVTLFKGYELTWAENNSLIKPVWMQTLEERQLEDLGETIKYGGFWIAPPDHPFYNEYDLGRESPAITFWKTHSLIPSYKENNEAGI